MSKKIALLAGATGLIGAELLNLLLSDESYAEVKVLTRKPLGFSHARLREIQLNFDDLQAHAAEMACDVVFSCLGSTTRKSGSRELYYKVDAGYPAEIARITLQHGAKQYFYISSLGASEKSFVYYSRLKATAEKLLAESGFPSVVIVRPSILLGDRREKRPAEKAAQWVVERIKPLMLGPLYLYRGIQAKDVALAMWSLAQQSLQGLHVAESDALQMIADSARPPAA